MRRAERIEKSESTRPPIPDLEAMEKFDRWCKEYISLVLSKVNDSSFSTAKLEFSGWPESAWWYEVSTQWLDSGDGLKPAFSKERPPRVLRAATRRGLLPFQTTVEDAIKVLLEARAENEKDLRVELH